MPGSCDPFRQNHKRIAADALLGIYGDVDENNLFLSIGKIQSWTDDTNPPRSVDSVKDDTDFWKSAFAHKRIDSADVSLVVRRYDWSAGVIYTPYRDDLDLFDDFDPAPFYALVDEERVYKCIDNNNGVPSMVAPTHTDTRIRKLGDGYRWKFLYQIPESKRKFLTKTKGDSIGYMPVEYVEYLRTSDERILQWTTQESAVDGEISYIKINPDVQPFVVSKKCVFPSGDNTVVADGLSGAMGITISSPYLFLQADYYTDMVLSIDSGQGLGQRRVITNFVPSGGGNSAFVSVNYPFSSSISGGANASEFSIVPNIQVVGDGTSYQNSGNPYSQSAEVSIRFGATATSGVTSCTEFFEITKMIDSIELVDGGKNYTFASLNFVEGLFVPTNKVNLEDLATPIMSPPGGHGSNPVKELGASSIMISKEYSRNEGGAVSTENEYRQFALLLNPLLAEKQVRLRFYQPGLSGTFSVGSTAAQQATAGFDGAYGKVVSWVQGVSGHSGTNELVLTNIKNGQFEYNGTVSGLNIMTVDERTLAGSESRRLLKLKLAPTSTVFAGGGNDFVEGYVAHGIGNYATSTPPSRATADIYDWKPQLGSNLSGYLYLENVQGEFKYGERINQTDQMYSGFSERGLSGIGEIVAIDSLVQDGVDAYDQTTSLLMSWDGSNEFDSASFFEDNYQVFGGVGATNSANGYVMDWSVGASGTTGILRVSGTQGNIVAGMTSNYSDGVASVTTVLHTGELKYRSGDILYIQNMKPIQRGFEQKEEIKIVIDY